MQELCERVERARYTLADFLGCSAAVAKVKEQAARAARADLTVLLQGESGTGKELLAHAIHQASSRRDNPFVAVACPSVPRTLLESELFGYTEGAFTGAVRGGRPGKFEDAQGGTLFLDEVGEMPPEMQSTLLRVLNDHVVTRIGGHRGRHVDVRVIAATNKNLESEVQGGRFRSDLFYRLDVLTIWLPPLRERSEDIPILAEAMLQQRSSPARFTGAALQELCAYPWPGNVRELENVVEKCLANLSGKVITPVDLPPSVRRQSRDHSAPVRSIAEMERYTIAQACREAGYNLSAASRMLGISRPTLYRKLRKYQIPVPR